MFGCELIGFGEGCGVRQGKERIGSLGISWGILKIMYITLIALCAPIL